MLISETYEYLDIEISLSCALLMRTSRTEMDTSKRNSRKPMLRISNDDFDLKRRKLRIRHLLFNRRMIDEMYGLLTTYPLRSVLRMLLNDANFSKT